MASALGVLNPLVYRGYVYDHETGLYYLNSRYYDPKVGRFLNADILVSTGQGLLGNNMFAYCRNNPVMRVDTQGTFDKEAFDIDGDPTRDDKDVTTSASTGGKFVPNKYGKLGGPAHRGTIQKIVDCFKNNPKFTVETEHRISTPNGAKPYRYADVYVKVGKRSIVFQVGKNTNSGYPVARERYAIYDIINAGIDMVCFIPYN